MTTAAGQHNPRHIDSAVDNYDPDEVVPSRSPLMKVLHPKIEPSPSPPPDIPPAQIRHSSGDAVLLAYLDNGRRPEIARAAGYHGLPDVDEEDEDKALIDPASTRRISESHVDCSLSCCGAGQHSGTSTSPSLQHLAADAFQAFSAEHTRATVPRETPDIALSTRHLSLSDDRSQSAAYHLSSRGSKSDHAASEEANKSPISMISPSSSGLPPLQMDSPKSESNGQVLPSIRSTFADIPHIPAEPLTPADKDLLLIHGSGSRFTRSPPGTSRRFPPMSTSQVSPPISPNEAYPLSLPSPHSLPASSPYACYTSNGLGHRASPEIGANLPTETPSTEHSAPTPATTTSVADRMSIDGITNPPVGLYVCKYIGCNAPPFQTQYLLNSHANVHSSARPHYCPVQGCPRSEGGKGFKRKNEMIRHGLVHDSPGYICPFCSDKEHKYPRPDNLQRHVRVHHMDRDRDDPLLREVLSQRPEGPNRGRRRRGPAA